MTSNVRPFRPAGHKATSASLRDRLASVFIYGLAGWLLIKQSLLQGGGGLNLFLLLGLVYWVFIRRHVVQTSYFFRYHYLQATLGLLLWFGCCLLLIILSQTAGSLLSVVGLGSLGLPTNLLLSQVPYWVQMAYQIGVGALVVTQGLAAALGRLTRLPVVSDNAEFWA